jgi:hypothetical protein
MDLNIQFLARMDLRMRLKGLTFNDGSSLLPIYTEAELNSEPIKWLKYLLLDRAGVEPIEKIKSQIHRFALDNVSNAQEWVTERLTASSDIQRNVMVVNKLVPWDQGAQLKNFRVFNVDDVHVVFQEIKNDMAKGAHELWCCESDTASSGFNLGGRINFPKDDNPQIVELVWFASPRLIESVRIPEFDHPYLRAESSIIDPMFEITTLHIPDEYKSEAGEGLWEEDFVAVLSLLGTRRSAMNRLVSILQGFGANEVCFCFKIDDGVLTIIDWDTEIESSNLFL